MPTGKRTIVKALTKIMEDENTTVDQKLEAAKILASIITKPKQLKPKLVTVKPVIKKPTLLG